MITLVGPFFRHFCIMSVIISGNVLPTIENARYSNEERLANRVWNFKVADEWVKAASNRIKDFLPVECVIVDFSVTLKERENSLLMIAPLKSGNSYVPVNLIQNDKRKRTVIRDIGNDFHDSFFF